jgi:hypothetical protein
MFPPACLLLWVLLQAASFASLYEQHQAAVIAAAQAGNPEGH